MDCLANRLSLTPHSLTDSVYLQALFCAQQQQLCPPHRKAVTGLQVLAQYLSFFVWEWSGIYCFHPSMKPDFCSLFNPVTLSLH
jgi:hypothetical protein